MGQFESDATACFDREVMRFVLTCYHSTGAPLGPLRMWEQVLHNIVHKVKTGTHSLPTHLYTVLGKALEEAPAHAQQ
jgi:hypothetical protein